MEEEIARQPYCELYKGEFTNQIYGIICLPGENSINLIYTHLGGDYIAAALSLAEIIRDANPINVLILKTTQTKGLTARLSDEELAAISAIIRGVKPCISLILKPNIGSMEN